MVLDTLKQSLADFSDKVTSPVDTITQVTQSVKKKMIGPDTDLLERIEQTIQYTPYLAIVEKEMKLLITKIKKLRIAATKKQKLLDALTLLEQEIKAIDTFTQVVDQVPALLKQFEKHLKKGSLPTAYEKNTFIIDTVTLSAKDTNNVLTLFQETQIEITSSILEINKPFAEQHTLPLEKNYDYKTAKKTFHDAWKQAINTLIDDEYELTAQQKNLLYTTNELKRQQRLLEQALSDKRTGKDDKDTTRRINMAKQKIQILVTKDIPLHIKHIDAGLKKIATDEKNIQSTWSTYTKEYTIWKKELHRWLTANRTQTKKVITTETEKRTKLQTNNQKALNDLTKAYTKSTTTIEKDSTHEQLDTIKHILQADIESTDTYLHSSLDVLASYATQIHHHQKDLHVYTTTLEQYRQYIYGTQTLEKERIVQLKLLLSIKKRHADLSATIWHNLIDVENKIENSLASSIQASKEHVRICKAQQQDYEKEIGARNQEVKNYTAANKELHLADRAQMYMQSRLESLYITTVNTAYADILTQLHIANKAHITNLKKSSAKLHNDLEETNKQLKNLEKKTEATKQEKEQIKKTTDQLHRLELYIDVVDHHLSTEEEHAHDTEQLIKNYKKIADNHSKKKSFFEKYATTYIKKTKKAKHLPEQLPLPKQVRGKGI